MKTCKKCGKCGPHCLAKWLLIIGGLNWGFMGLLGTNIIENVFGAWGWLVTLIYVLVGLSAVLMIIEGKCGPCKK
jgi:uncharacterized protein